MSDEKFTQGEWEVEERSEALYGCTWVGFLVFAPETGQIICCSETESEKNIPEMQANVSLITAAPKMYGVLKRLVDLTDYAELVGVIHDAKAVLRKVRGEE